MSFESANQGTLQQELAGLSTSDARASLYYLSRYLKQVALFDGYQKDIFDDDVRAAPSDEVRRCTIVMIASIEAAEGASAAQFDDETYDRWAREVKRIESALEAEPSPEERARAAHFLDSMVLPDNQRR